MRECEKEMEQFKEDFQLEENYFAKFGHLKKASILLNRGWLNAAHSEIANAVVIVAKQRQADQARIESIKKRWKFKLGIDQGWEPPAKLFAVPPDQLECFMSEDQKKQLVKKKKKSSGQDQVDNADEDTQYPKSTIKIFVENCSPWVLQAGNRDHSLNELIEQFMLMVEAKMKRIEGDKLRPQPGSIEMYNRQLKELAEWQEFDGQPEEAWADDGDDDGKGRKRKYKPPKTKMCSNWVRPRSLVERGGIDPHTGKPRKVDMRDYEKDKKGNETYRPKSAAVHLCTKRVIKSTEPEKLAMKCKDAHNPIELTLVSNKRQQNQIQKVIDETKKTLKENKMAVPFVPAGRQDPIQKAGASMFAPYHEVKTHTGKDNNKEDGDGPKSIFDRENPFKKPFEE